MHGWIVSDKGERNNRNRKMHFNNKLKQINEVLKYHGSVTRIGIEQKLNSTFELSGDHNYCGPSAMVLCF